MIILFFFLQWTLQFSVCLHMLHKFAMPFWLSFENSEEETGPRLTSDRGRILGRPATRNASVGSAWRPLSSTLPWTSTSGLTQRLPRYILIITSLYSTVLAPDTEFRYGWQTLTRDWTFGTSMCLGLSIHV